MLQWGHVFSDVEILSEVLVKDFYRIMLQWGHVFSDVEISQMASCNVMLSSFNGATSFQTWKSSRKGNNEDN